MSDEVTEEGIALCYMWVFPHPCGCLHSIMLIFICDGNIIFDLHFTDLGLMSKFDAFHPVVYQNIVTLFVKVNVSTALQQFGLGVFVCIDRFSLTNNLMLSIPLCIIITEV
jgi:hypothetical protein